MLPRRVNEPSGAQAEYEALLADGVFMIQRCHECRAHVFFPRQICPQCGESSLEWTEPSGFGTVYATTTVCLEPHKPYEVSLIELDEGVRIMSRVEGVSAGTVAIGLRVKLRVIQEQGVGLVVSYPVPEAT